MPLVVLTIPVAVLVGYMAGGRLGNYSGAMWFVIRGMRRPASQAAEAEDRRPGSVELSTGEAS